MIERGNQDWQLMSRPKIDFVDGTPRSSQFDDDYYSPTDGLAESEYVFLEGADVRRQMASLTLGQTLVVTELGVGTALNLLLLMETWQDVGPANAHCHYIGIEKFPLSLTQLKTLNSPFKRLSKNLNTLLERWPSPLPGCHRRKNLVKGFTADFWFEDVKEALIDLGSHHQRWVDIWFLDGFTPVRNETMWSSEVLACVAELSTPGAVVATFTAAGKVRKRLEDNGFTVTKRAGFGKKRECIHAHFLSDTPAITKHFSSPKLTQWDQPQHWVAPKHCLVIGGGMAGCHVARNMAEMGCRVTLLEQNQIASGGSVQPQGVIYTRPSHKHSKLSDFSLGAYAYSVDHHHQKFANNTLEVGVDGELNGYIQLSDTPTQEKLGCAFDDPDSPLRLISASEASRISGIKLERPGIHFPQSGWLNPQGVCRELLEHDNIRVIEGVGPMTLEQHESLLWIACNAEGKTLAVGDTSVVTTAWAANQDKRLQWLPLQPIRGQTTMLDSKGALAHLNCTVCHEGYTPPARLGSHCVGATYGLNDVETNERDEDHQTNVSQLLQNIPSLAESVTAGSLRGAAAIRCATSDYLPIVGSVPNETEFNATFAGFRHDRKRIIDAKQPNYLGLWLMTGLGSRGLTSAPILAEVLVSQMFRRAPPLPRYLLQAISPARFLKRRLIRGN